MNQPPIVAGLVLCEQYEVDPSNARVNLRGIFQTRMFPTFPSPPASFTVFATLFDGMGEGLLQLTITNLQPNALVHRYRRWFAFPDNRLLPVNLEIKIRQCIFPSPGRYALELSFDSQSVSERTLQVSRGVP
jgi:hypothetical protein